jgi:hypothetical protein
VSYKYVGKITEADFKKETYYTKSRYSFNNKIVYYEAETYDKDTEYYI